MRYTISAGTYAGIPVRVHFTFPLILIVFGVEAWVRGTWVDAARAVALTLSVFVCVILHEFGHSLQVKRYGIRVRDIVLLPIGGMARAERIPENPWHEIVVAISGPLVNFVLAAALAVVVWWRQLPLVVGESFATDLLFINLVLGTFNLVPAFPMDGGRILRGLLAIRLPYLSATRLARATGQLIALAFVVAGFVYGELMMLPVIAVFIFFGAITEENAIRVKTWLDGKSARDLVAADEPVLYASDTVEAAMRRTVGSHAEALAVTDETHSSIAVASRRDLQAAAASGRGEDPVGTLASVDFPVVDADMPAIQVYYFLKSENRRFAGVVDDGAMVGILHRAAMGERHH